MSEKTLASSRQLLTMAGRVTVALSPIDMETGVAQFWIDQPEALNWRIKQLATLPTIVEVFGRPRDPCRGLAGLINMTPLGEKYDMYAFDRIIESQNSELNIHERTEIAVVDSAELYKKLCLARDRQGKRLEVTILFVNQDKDLIPITPENVHVLQTEFPNGREDALNWLRDYRSQSLWARIHLLRDIKTR